MQRNRSHESDGNGVLQINVHKIKYNLTDTRERAEHSVNKILLIKRKIIE